MHRALLVKELFLSILDHLGASSTEATNRDSASLASLAVVCREWHEPALDRLWRMQRTLVPLLKTLPMDKWKVGEDKLFVRNSVVVNIACH